MTHGRLPSIDFNAQHAPMGAFMSFTCGNFGAGGGIGVEIGRPADQNIYIGVKDGDRAGRGPLRCMPFVRKSSFAPAAANFQGSSGAHHDALPASIELIAADQIHREVGWATDTWTAGELSFAIHTPFGPIPEPPAAGGPLRDALLPAIIATLTLDNRAGQNTCTAFFALDFPDSGTRLIRPAGDEALADSAPLNDASRGARLGFAWRRQMGVMGMPQDQDADGFFAFQRWSVAEGLCGENPAHDLASCAGLAMEVPAGTARTLVLAIGVYLEGIVTTGLDARYYYTRHYASLDEVLSSALDRADELRSQSARLDQLLRESALSPDQQFLLAHGTRGYYACTQLLDVAGQALFVVNEGEYCMMNTLDLAVDHAFWELERNPWVVRNILDAFSHRYCYHDQVQAHPRRIDELLTGGISFCHDMGVNNNFSRPGHSSYELPHHAGCFSYMTQEQLCNWILLAGCYVARTGDVEWLRENEHLLWACAQSLRNRAHPRTGMMAHDSARCGQNGQEITTYDSLDESLGQARANLYLAVKCFAAWIGIEMLRQLAGDETTDPGGGSIEPLTDLLADFLTRSAGDDGVFPAVLERGNRAGGSRILPAVEGLLYPAYWLRCLQQHPHEHAEQIAMLQRRLNHPLVEALRRHCQALLFDPAGRNLFADGGIRLSSTSDNSWMSKIAIFQHVARDLLRLHLDHAGIEELFARADSAHVRWQTEGAAYWACSDQFINGIAKASRFYPRLIAACLWLNEIPSAARTPGASPNSTEKHTLQN